MMRKSILIVLAIALALSLTACDSIKSKIQGAVKDSVSSALSEAIGGESDEDDSSGDESDSGETSGDSESEQDGDSGNDSSESDEGGAADVVSVASLIGWMKDGTFSYDFEMTSEGGGLKTESTGSLAMDGKNLAVTTETTADGNKIKAHIIIKDDTMYIVDDTTKFIMKLPVSNLSELMGGLITDYSDITLVGSGVGEINGKTLPYEEYESDSAKIKYFLDGGNVYGTESEYEGFKTVMIISNASNKAPAGAFDLPEGYIQF